MSSALDEDTQQALAAGRDTAGAMLRSAQKDLQKVFIVFLVGFLGTFYALRLYVWKALYDITRSRMDQLLREDFLIIAQTPFDVILLQAKISLVAGIIIGLPVFLYFSRDALKARGLWPQAPVPLWKLVLIGLATVVLFLLGAAYGYFLFFPLMFQFLASNAATAGFSPHWSIVMWAEFIFLLTMSFGLAAQMPLAITGLSYSGIVQYETFRDRWRHAVVAIFVFGAVFSPPDPFTQIMWAAPLLVLYGFSLYLAKVAVTMRRGTERLSATGVVGRNWNLLAAALVAGAGFVWVFYRSGGREAVNSGLAAVGSRRRFLPLGNVTGLSATADLALFALAVGLVFAVVAFLYAAYREVEASVSPEAATGDPTGIDLGALDEEGVRAAPVEAFEQLSEAQALDAAQDAIDADEQGKAQAILDRYDEVHADEGDAGEPAPHEAEPLLPPTGALGAIRRGAGWVDWRQRARESWNLLAMLGVVLFGVGYLLATAPERASELLSQAGFGGVTVPDLAATLGLSETAALGVVAVGVLAVVAIAALLVALLASYAAGTDPTAIDVQTLTTDELRRAPPATFAAMSEARANYLADRALRRGDDERASIIYDRYDAVNAEPDEDEAAEPTPAEEAEPAPGSVGDRAQRASSTFLSEFAEDDDAEDDIGGYYQDIAFIVDTLTSKTFRIVGVFMVTLASVFAWLYTGGIGAVYDDFLDKVPQQVVGEGQTVLESMNVIALHPVEALIFEVKVSTLVGLVVVAPLVAYYAWPALRERGFVRGHRRVIFGWAAVLFGGLVAGLALGYSYIAPTVISYLVADALRANMVISYRISDFFWMVIFLTVGIGFLFDIPVLMVLLNSAGVSYQAMRTRWREVTVAILLFAALFTPADVLTMFMVTIPLMTAYGVGLGVLFLVTLGGRRNLREPIVEGKDRDAETPS